MVAILMQHKVEDFAKWKNVFDSALGMRTSSGELSAEVFRDQSDPNSITILNKWDSIENAQKFVQSPDLHAAMTHAGVVGMPSVTFLTEA